MPSKKIIGKKEEPEDQSFLAIEQLQECAPQSVPRNMVLTHIVNASEHIGKLARIRKALIGRADSEGIDEDAFSIATKGFAGKIIYERKPRLR